MYLATVDCATVNPSLRIPMNMRRSPQRVFKARWQKGAGMDLRGSSAGLGRARPPCQELERHGGLAETEVLTTCEASRSGSCQTKEARMPTSRLLTQGEYTFRIEGPAVDAAGNLFVMNLGTDGVIGKLSPGATKSVPFATL